MSTSYFAVKEKQKHQEIKELQYLESPDLCGFSMLRKSRFTGISSTYIAEKAKISPLLSLQLHKHLIQLIF